MHTLNSIPRLFLDVIHWRAGHGTTHGHILCGVAVVDLAHLVLIPSLQLRVTRGFDDGLYLVELHLKGFLVKRQMRSDAIKHPGVCNTGESLTITLDFGALLLLLVGPRRSSRASAWTSRLTGTNISVVELISLAEPGIIDVDQVTHIWNAKGTNSIPYANDLDHCILGRRSNSGGAMSQKFGPMRTLDKCLLEVLATDIVTVMLKKISHQVRLDDTNFLHQTSCGTNSKGTTREAKEVQLITLVEVGNDEVVCFKNILEESETLGA
ncbi:hypothetical protein HG530_008587 [Fusarium avenaceum]|nr:hypothetical protein HG530_008587 [Fusarium avenaceum]